MIAEKELIKFVYPRLNPTLSIKIFSRLLATLPFVLCFQARPRGGSLVTSPDPHHGSSWDHAMPGFEP